LSKLLQQGFWRFCIHCCHCGERGLALEWCFGLVSAIVDQNLTLVATNNKTFTVGLDSFDVEAVHLGVLVQQLFKVTWLVTVDDVTLVCTNQESTIC
jgi:hypothetical protein